MKIVSTAFAPNLVTGEATLALTAVEAAMLLAAVNAFSIVRDDPESAELRIEMMGKLIALMRRFGIKITFERDKEPA